MQWKQWQPNQVRDTWYLVFFLQDQSTLSAFYRQSVSRMWTERTHFAGMLTTDLAGFCTYETRPTSTRAIFAAVLVWIHFWCVWRETASQLDTVQLAEEANRVTAVREKQRNRHCTPSCA